MFVTNKDILLRNVDSDNIQDKDHIQEIDIQDSEETQDVIMI